MCVPAADIRVGDLHRRVLLVGACPGRDEEANGRPFSGEAGQNLNIMLQRLHALHPNIFPTGRADDYSMVNAHSLPRYPGRQGYDGRTQPRKREVLAQENRARLVAHLLAIQAERVVYLGKAAGFSHEVILALQPNIQAYRTGHPSTQAWNTRLPYVGLQRFEKICRWAEDQFALVG